MRGVARDVYVEVSVGTRQEGSSEEVRELQGWGFRESVGVLKEVVKRKRASVPKESELSGWSQVREVRIRKNNISCRPDPPRVAFGLLIEFPPESLLRIPPLH